MRNLCVLFVLWTAQSAVADVEFQAHAWGDVGATCQSENDVSLSYDDPPRFAPSARFASGQKDLQSNCFSPIVGTVVSHTAFATSSASTKGTLHVDAEASGSSEEPIPSDFPFEFAEANANASFLNFLVIHQPSEDPSATGVGVFGMRVDGRITGLANVDACISVNFEPTCRSAQGPGQFSFPVSQAINLNGQEAIAIFGELQASAFATNSLPDTFAEFGHTGQAFLELPPGWTFTSASGEFLAPSSVAEQSTRFSIALLLLVALLYRAWVSFYHNRQNTRKNDFIPQKQKATVCALSMISLFALNGCNHFDPNVTTQHNDSFRTGAYLAEITLTPDRVLRQGMHVRYWVAPKDAYLPAAPPGEPAYQPDGGIDGGISTQLLYVRGVPFSTGVANGLFAATGPNYGVTLAAKVYALNADDGSRKWAANLMAADPDTCRIPRAVETTPVIDLSRNRLFVVFSTQAGGDNCGVPSIFGNVPIKFFLAAIDITNGNATFKQVQGRDARTGVPFIERFQNSHPALLLDHDSVYVAFGSDAALEDTAGTYRGWVMRYSAVDLSLQNVFCTSPTVMGAGVWQGGGGLAADGAGNIYFLTGNGIADFERHFNGRTFLTNHLYGDSFVKLSLSGGQMVPAAFAPEDAADLLSLDPTVDPANPPPCPPFLPQAPTFGGGLLCRWDADLGSGGAMIIPSANRVIGGGKTGVMYVLDQESMARVQQFAAATNEYHPWDRWQNWDVGPHLHGSPTYWRGPDNRYGNLYVWGEKDVLKLYKFDTQEGKFATATTTSKQAPAALGVLPFVQTDILAIATTMPGGMLSVSADGNKKNTGIVWATLPVATCMPSLNPCGRGPAAAVTDRDLRL